MYSLRDIKPKFDFAVAEWLSALAGNKTPALLAWLSNLTADEPRKSLVLTGAPGSGKTLLVQGLARLWTVPLKDLYHLRFGCDAPLLVVDEVSSVFDYRCFSAKIGTVEEKGQAPRPAAGYRRLVATSNVVPEHLEGASRHFLHVPCYDAESILNEHSGALDSWVEGDRIAAHVLALPKHERVITPVG